MHRRTLPLLAGFAITLVAMLVLAGRWFERDAPSTVRDVSSMTVAVPTADATVDPDLPDDSRLRHRTRRKVVERADATKAQVSVQPATKERTGCVVGRLRVVSEDADCSVDVMIVTAAMAAGLASDDASDLRRLERKLGSASFRGGDRKRVRPPDHRFEFGDLQVGAYVLAVQRGGAVVAQKNVDVQGRIEVEIDLPPVKEEETLIVSVLDDKRRPLDRMQFLVSFDSGLHGLASDVRLDGSYRVGPSSVIADALAGHLASCTLRVGRNDLGVQTVEVLPGRRELTVVFDLAARAQVLVDVSGFAAATFGDRVSVMLRQGAGSDRKEVRMQTSAPVDASGRASFERLEPGDWDASLMVRAVLADESSSSLGALLAAMRDDVPVARLRAHLVPGENRIVMAMPQLYTLTVSAEVTRESEVRISRVDDREAPPLSQCLAQSGTVTFDLLPAGRYQVGTTEHATVVVNLPEQSEVRFARRDAGHR